MGLACKVGLNKKHERFLHALLQKWACLVQAVVDAIYKCHEGNESMRQYVPPSHDANIRTPCWLNVKRTVMMDTLYWTAWECRLVVGPVVPDFSMGRSFFMFRVEHAREPHISHESQSL
jgi:hypothetical protein